MSKILKLSSALPADEHFNGLDHIAEQLEIGQRVAAFAVFECIEINHTKGGDVPKVTLARVEPLGAPGEIPATLAELVMKAGERRTGSDPLPLDAVVAPTKHPDVCDHNWHVEGDNLEDVPVGMERKTCLRCGHVKFFPLADDDLLAAEEAAAVQEALDASEEDVDGPDADTVAVVPHDADVTILDPFRKRAGR